jgi:hypothetical protein
MVSSSVSAYGGISSHQADTHIEIAGVADTGFSIMYYISIAAPIIVAFALVTLIILANRYVVDKYVKAGGKSKIQKFILEEIIDVITILLVISVFFLLWKIQIPDFSLKEELLSINLWLLIVIFIIVSIIIAIKENWKEWKFFKKWND